MDHTEKPPSRQKLNNIAYQNSILNESLDDEINPHPTFGQPQIIQSCFPEIPTYNDYILAIFEKQISERRKSQHRRSPGYTSVLSLVAQDI